ncbi:MAG: aminotransferase class I/II-fold pyridoxal phosphate-dependent enzyme [Anaerolineae bacterium]|nr:aminotransferase class I/II-fold pyridoxal phosphate-dependent enzyme [Anaerolineae bacterium]
MNFETAVPARVRNWLPSKVSKTVRTGGMSALVAQAEQVFHLGQGDVGFVTPSHVREAAIKAIEAGETRYKLLPELKEAIAQKLQTDNGITVDPKKGLLLSDGAHAVLFQIMATLVGPGDEVIMTTPGAYYEKNTIFQGGTPVTIVLKPEDNFRLDPAAIEAAITQRTKIIGLTIPNAPTGVILSQRDVEQIAEIAQRHDLLVISDEIYEKINFGNHPHVSIASLPGMAERTITVNGFSKGYAMTGWRVGYAAIPEWLFPAVDRVNALNTIWLNTPAQYAALAALTGPQEPFQEMVAEYKRRMRLVVDGLNAIDGVRCFFPDGTYYSVADIRSFGFTSEQFAGHLFLTEQVLVQAGTIFGSGGEGLIRVSCSAPEAEILASIERFRRSVERLRDSGLVQIEEHMVE